MEIKDIQRIAKKGFDLWQYGKRVESMEKLCQSYAHLTEGEASDSIDLEIRQHLLHGIERYFRIIPRAKSIPIDELAKIEVVLELRLGCHHEKTVTLCRRIAELCVAPTTSRNGINEPMRIPIAATSTAAMPFRN